ncbi:MAG: glycosyltransferase family 4 protein [Cyclobacteriaceae bacterium]
MKIMFVIDSLGTGGAERSTADLWYYLKENNIQIKVVALRRRKEGIEEEVLAANFDVHFVNQGNIFRQVAEINGVIKRFRPDVVHSVLFKSNLRVRLARRRNRFYHIESLVNCMYDPIRLEDPSVGFLTLKAYKWIDRLSIRWVDHFVAITNTVKIHYQRNFSIDDSKVSVIYRGRKENPYLDIKSKVRTDCRNELALSPDSLLVIHIGRREFQKGHLILLKAIKRIEGKLKVPVAFVFLGREGNSSSEIERFINDNSFSAKMFFLGHRLDVDRWLASGDIFAFPSRYEGLGGALIEAQAAGLPVICSDLTVLNEVVVRNRNARMFEEGDSRGLADHLIEMISSQNLRHNYGLESVANFRNRFELRKINQQTLALYNKYLKN